MTPEPGRLSGPGQLQIVGRAPDRRAADFFSQRRPLHGSLAMIKTSITLIYVVCGSQGDSRVALANQRQAVRPDALIA